MAGPLFGSLDLLGEKQGEREGERESLVWTNLGLALGLVHETHSESEGIHVASYNPGPGLLPSEQRAIFFNYVEETPVTKDTFLVNLQGGLEFWGHPSSFFLSLSCVWAVDVSANKLECMPPRDLGHW